MVTKEQAMTGNEFHYLTCTVQVGPRGGERRRGEVWRRSGQTQTWKTRPDAFRVPIKHGLYTSHEITERTASAWHLAEECIPKRIETGSR